MQLMIRSQTNYVLNVESDATLNNLAATIAKIEKCHRVALYCQGKPLNIRANVSVATLGGCSIDVILPLQGGKTHGKLNNAGKVKGLTPHVDQTEPKNKKKCGRARQRQKYNKRFKNSTEGTKNKGHGKHQQKVFQ